MIDISRMLKAIYRKGVILFMAFGGFGQDDGLKRRRSRMAITSSVMSLLFAGCCFIGPVPFVVPLVAILMLGFAIIGFCLGIVAFIRIKYVDPSLSGMCYAMAGIAIPLLMLLRALLYSI